MSDLQLPVGLAGEDEKVHCCDVAPAGEHVIQTWVLGRLGKVVLPIGKCLVGSGWGQTR